MTALCPGRPFGWGHKFRPRYEEVPIPGLVELLPGATINGATLSRTVCRSVYVRDVCVRCGATVERTDSMAPGATGKPAGAPVGGGPVSQDHGAALAGLYAGRAP